MQALQHSENEKAYITHFDTVFEKNMNHRLTFRQYRQMDLTVFGAMLVVAEALIVLAATRWFPAEA